MLVLYLLLTVGVGLAVFASLVVTQHKTVVDGKTWADLSREREEVVITDPARRGNIYSSDGKVLATMEVKCYLYLDLFNDTVRDRNGQVERDRNGRVKETGPIVDSNFTRYLDTVCDLLAEGMPRYSAAHFRQLLTAERAKTRRNRCLRVVRELIPYSTWMAIRGVPGWDAGVVKMADDKRVDRNMRAHIYGNLAQNVIGFPNATRKNPFTGLEGYYDSVLRGQDGVFKGHRLTRGIYLPEQPHDGDTYVRTDLDNFDTVMLQRKEDGRSIVATIDTRYQDIAESSLRRTLHRYGGSSGTAILMEMETGYVLACANLSIDTARHEYLEMRDANIAVSHIYEPGSTFKTVILNAMMEDPKQRIDTAMRLAFGRKDFGGKDGVITDDHTIAGRDSLSLKEVIEQSSNVGMSDLGWRLYRNRRDTLRTLVEQIFPFGPIHPDLAAPEYRTHTNDLNQSKRDFLNFCYGYSTQVTPLQLITYYNALGAGGRMVKPLFCRAIIDGDRHTEVSPVVLNPQMCSKRSARLLLEMLEGVVEHGTGTNIRNTTYGIAGKTGTAVHSYANRTRYNSSFAGFFPSEHPKYTCLVMIEDIPAYGRQAAEVFKNISDCVVAIDKDLSKGGVKSLWPRLEEDSAMAQQRPVLTRGNQQEIMTLYRALRLPYPAADSSAEWVAYRRATDSTAARYAAYTPTEGRVPNCNGMTAKDAIALLHSQGYKVKINGYGKVSAQNPKAGANARKGATVVITLK